MLRLIAVFLLLASSLFSQRLLRSPAAASPAPAPGQFAAAAGQPSAEEPVPDVSFQYTLGDTLPLGQYFDIFSSGFYEFNIALPPPTESWIDATLNSYTTPAVLKIGLKKDKIPPPGVYNGIVIVTAGRSSLSFLVVLTVRAASGFPSGNVLIPHFACGGGWTTTLYLNNAVTSSSTSTITVLDNAGAPLSLAATTPIRVSLNPEGAASISFGPKECPAPREGFLKLTLPEGVIASAVFQQSGPGASTQEAVAPAATTLTSATVPFDETGNYLSALALLCTAAAPGLGGDILEISALDQSGLLLGAASVPLQKDTKTTLVLRERIPAVAGKLGSLKIRSTSGAFAALGFRFNGAAFTSISVK